MNTIQPYSNGSESPPSRLESRSEDPLHRKSSKGPSKCRHNNRKNKDEKQHSSSSKSSSEKYDPCSESETEEDKRLMHKRISRHCSVQDSRTERDSSIDCYEKSIHHQIKEFKVIHPVDDRIREALDYRTYHPVDKSCHYDDEVASCKKRPKLGQTSTSPNDVASIRFVRPTLD